MLTLNVLDKWVKRKPAPAAGPAGRFICQRNFYLAGGVLAAKDSVVTLDDKELIEQLLNAGRIQPADAATAKRVEIRAQVQWREAEDSDRRPSPWIAKY